MLKEHGGIRALAPVGLVESLDGEVTVVHGITGSFYYDHL